MKINFLFVLFFGFFISHVSAQECFIVTTKGDKIPVDCSSVVLNNPDNDKFEYQQPNSNKKEKIKLDDIANARLGEYRIETFSMEKKPKPYFIIVDSDQKKLVGYNRVHTNQNLNPGGQSGFSSIVNYDYFILDATNQLIQKLEFDTKYGDKFAQKRDEVNTEIVKHFSECKQFMKRLNAVEIQLDNVQTDSKVFKNSIKRFEEGKYKITNSLNNPKYSNCNEVVQELVANNKAEKEDLTQYDGTYRFETFHMKSKMLDREMGIEGSLSIKDNMVEFKAKSGGSVYKIKNIKEGVIYLQDKSMLHTLTIIQETGKKKRFDYDYKILFVSDPEMSYSCEYWCKKE